MKRTRLLVVALAAVLGLLLPALALPAQADHVWVHGHWGRRWSQTPEPPVYDRNMTFRGGFSFAADAAGYWGEKSKRYGYYTVRPYVAAFGGGGGCSAPDWTIVICGTTGLPRDARATILKENATGHIISCLIELDVNKLYWASDYLLQIVVRHEMGHCLGIGHTANNTVMRGEPYPEATTIYVGQHDIDALHDLYYWHGHS